MKKSAFPAALLLLGVFASGCPVYEDDDGCFSDSECRYGYVCDGRTGSCTRDTTDEKASCYRPTDCDANETCSRFGTCLSGDCHFSSVGCVSGYECAPEMGRWQCVKLGAASDGGAANAGAASVDGGNGGDANPSDGGTNSAAGAGG